MEELMAKKQGDLNPIFTGLEALLNVKTREARQILNDRVFQRQNRIDLVNCLEADGYSPAEIAKLLKWPLRAVLAYRDFEWMDDSFCEVTPKARRAMREGVI
jgi:hypothetical protein